MNRRARLQAGYSLTEMLVVLAIIGIMTVIAVPAFMNYYKQTKLKSGMRVLTSDMRSARQRAATRNEMTKVTVNIGLGAGTWRVYESTDGLPTSNAGKVWTALAQQQRLPAPVYISDSNMKTGSTADVIFLPDGTAQLPSGVSPGTVLVKTDDNIPVQTYTISIYVTGKISAN